MKYIQIYNFTRCRNQVFFLFPNFSSSRRKLKTQKLQNLKTVYTYSFLLKNPLINIVRSLYVYEAVIRIGALKHLTNTVKIVKKEYIYEVASLKSSTLQDKLELLHSFFSKDLAKVLTAYNSLKFIMAASVYLP